MGSSLKHKVFLELPDGQILPAIAEVTFEANRVILRQFTYPWRDYAPLRDHLGNSKGAVIEFADLKTICVLTKMTITDVDFSVLSGDMAVSDRIDITCRKQDMVTLTQQALIERRTHEANVYRLPGNV